MGFEGKCDESLPAFRFLLALGAIVISTQVVIQLVYNYGRLRHLNGRLLHEMGD